MIKKVIYKIGQCEKGTFIDRPNRFISDVDLKGEKIVCHVHDSGRIKELLYPGNSVTVKKAKDVTKRKTAYDLISAFTEDGEEILLNSSLHRYISENLLKDPEVSPFGTVDKVIPEVKYDESRLDFLLEKNTKLVKEKIWVEVKGVSLSLNKIAMFPDAPSVRATKHLNELMKLKKGGDRAAVLLLILRDSDYFRPKFETDSIFYKTFYKAIKNGVEIYPVQCFLKNGKIYYTDKKINILKEEIIK